MVMVRCPNLFFYVINSKLSYQPSCHGPILVPTFHKIFYNNKTEIIIL